MIATPRMMLSVVLVSIIIMAIKVIIVGVLGILFVAMCRFVLVRDRLLLSDKDMAHILSLSLTNYHRFLMAYAFLLFSLVVLVAYQKMLYSFSVLSLIILCNRFMIGKWLPDTTHLYDGIIIFMTLYFFALFFAKKVHPAPPFFMPAPRPQITAVSTTVLPDARQFDRLPARSPVVKRLIKTNAPRKYNDMIEEGDIFGTNSYTHGFDPSSVHVRSSSRRQRDKIGGRR